ncbi:MAG TPA: zinc-ribbon and DUF3426 domain-containing protein [Steroidobacteraceae bacterium]|nr:zinc-ribbon and DUF3426 domain-containing protein [Steroidobacteraceae bacterium]
MFTVCPKCSLKLVVTAADLRVAQGYVRCGRCADVFNALAGLSDEEQAALAQASAQALSAEPRAPERAREPEPLAARPSSAPASDTSLEFNPASTDVSKIFVEPELDAESPTGTFESIVLASDDAPAEELELAPDPEPVIHETELDLDELRVELDASELTMPAPSLRAEPLAPAASAAAPAAESPIAALPAVVREPKVAVSLASELSEPRAGGRRASGVLAAASGLLALALVAQIVHHFRAGLAQVGWLGPPLRSFYARIGLPLAPRWDVSAYEVRQLGAVAGPQSPGTLMVRASIKNNAARAQPLPLLRVTVQDRFGNRVAARDVPPGAYLPGKRATEAYLPAGQRIDAEMAFVDPGPRVVGFEIDACLKDAAGRIACAHEASDSGGD